MSVRGCIGLCLLVLALGAAGCGGDDDEDEATTDATASAETTTAATGPAPAECIDAWNAPSNSGGQQELASVYVEGASGSVFVGVEEGACVLASFPTGDANGVVYTEADGTFTRASDVPLAQYDQYRASVSGTDVLVPFNTEGTIKPSQ